MNRILMSLPALLLAACASTPGNPVPAAVVADSAPAKQLHTDLVREMIAQGRHYAALAHIEELQKSGGPQQELLLLHARVLAKLDRREQAEQEFRQLLGSRFDGEARHGLGLLHADRSHRQSLQYLREAAQSRPTDPDIRNDYGYALLAGGQYPEARLQLATAYELDGGATDRYRNNYLLALMLFKDERELERVRRQGEVGDTVMRNLRAQAQGWPAVVQRTLSATATAPSGTAAASRTAPAATVERTDKGAQKPAQNSPQKPSQKSVQKPVQKPPAAASSP